MFGNSWLYFYLQSRKLFKTKYTHDFDPLLPCRWSVHVAKEVWQVLMEQSLCLVRCVPKWAPSAQTVCCFLIECGRSNLLVRPSPAGPFLVLDVLIYGLFFFSSFLRRVRGRLWWWLQRINCRNVWGAAKRSHAAAHRHPQRAWRVRRQQGLFPPQPRSQVPSSHEHVPLPRYNPASSASRISWGVNPRNKNWKYACFLLKLMLFLHSWVLGQPSTLHLTQHLHNVDIYGSLDVRCECNTLRLAVSAGVLLGIAIRTGSPLSLNLAEPVWKQLAGMNLTIADLSEVGMQPRSSAGWAFWCVLLCSNDKDFENVTCVYVQNLEFTLKLLVWVDLVSGDLAELMFSQFLDPRIFKKIYILLRLSHTQTHTAFTAWTIWK